MIYVVGLGAAPLTPNTPEAGTATARVIATAPLVVGYPRQLALVTGLISGSSCTLHAPLRETLTMALAQAPDGAAVLASGDPLFHGIGAAVRDCAPAGTPLEFLPTPTAVSLAAAELGWSYDDIPVVSLTTHPVEKLRKVMAPHQRAFIYGVTASLLPKIADFLCGQGYDASSLWLLSDLGTDQSACWSGTARDLREEILARSVRPGAVSLLATQWEYCDPRDPQASCTAGLPDELFTTSRGQLTKRDMRAVTLAQLMPCPGEELWDIGAGSGAIAVEWCRLSGGTAHCFESVPERHADIAANAARCGVTSLYLHGAAPAALAEVESSPSAVFIGGGVTSPGLVEECWQRLASGGRLVATAVTTESLHVLEEACTRYGGQLTEYSESHYEPLGRFHTWRPVLRHVQWVVEK